MAGGDASGTTELGGGDEGGWSKLLADVRESRRPTPDSLVDRVGDEGGIWDDLVGEVEGAPSNVAGPSSLIPCGTVMESNTGRG